MKNWTKEIPWFENQLTKVKAAHNPNDFPHDEFKRKRCDAYIAQAERELEAVKKGENPYK